MKASLSKFCTCTGYIPGCLSGASISIWVILLILPPLQLPLPRVFPLYFLRRTIGICSGKGSDGEVGFLQLKAGRLECWQGGRHSCFPFCNGGIPGQPQRRMKRAGNIGGGSYTNVLGRVEDCPRLLVMAACPCWGWAFVPHVSKWLFMFLTWARLRARLRSADHWSNSL